MGSSWGGLGCLKYPGQDVLVKPGFRNFFRFMWLGSVLGRRVHRPTVHPPWAQPVVSFPFLIPMLLSVCSLTPSTGTPAPSSALLQDFPLIQGFGPCSPGPIIKSHQLCPISWKFPAPKSPSWVHHSLIARNFNYLLKKIFKQTTEVM